MEKILITGASGTLGKRVLRQLDLKKYQVRVLQHRVRNQIPEVKIVIGDLTTGAGLAEAVSGIDTILHLASSANTKGVDVIGTKKLVEEGRTAGVQRIIYQSIVGIDRIPFAYYKAKVAAEDIIKTSGLDWTIFRATQFHQLLNMTLNGLARLPILLVPGNFKFQPVDPSEVATHLIQGIEAATSGYLPELGGPQTLTFHSIAKSWQQAKGLRKPMLPLPLPGKTATAFRQGYNTTSQQYGQISWQEWLDRKYQNKGD